jgi:5-methylcytosine-specific restriction endonuclease McrA
MSDYVPAGLRRLARDRAECYCEYCKIHEDDAFLPHEPDHIIATKHRGETEETNLAWTCFVCNRAKGSDLSSIDVETGQLVRLFNPRIDNWDDHFVLERDGRISAHTDVGRVTEFLLKLNQPKSVEIRRVLSQRRHPE